MKIEPGRGWTIMIEHVFKIQKNLVSVELDFCPWSRKKIKELENAGYDSYIDMGLAADKFVMMRQILDIQDKG